MNILVKSLNTFMAITLGKAPRTRNTESNHIRTLQPLIRTARLSSRDMPVSFLCDQQCACLLQGQYGPQRF